jgi:hypothetical protein
MIQRNVHHQGKRPTRTCLVAPEFSKHANKWSAAFQIWATPEEGDDYMVSSLTSGALFATPEEAYEAGGRAMDVLQATDKFPNMCEVF